MVEKAMPWALRYFSVESMSETTRWAAAGDYSTIFCVVNDLINI
jgi:hypothetical protein